MLLDLGQILHPFWVLVPSPIEWVTCFHHLFGPFCVSLEAPCQEMKGSSVLCMEYTWEEAHMYNNRKKMKVMALLPLSTVQIWKGKQS